MQKDRSAKCAHWAALSNTSPVPAGCHILGPCHAACDAASRWGVTPLQVGPLFVINPCTGNLVTWPPLTTWPGTSTDPQFWHWYLHGCKARYWLSLLLKLPIGFKIHFLETLNELALHYSCVKVWTSSAVSSECASLLPKISPTPAASERPQGYQGLLDISSLRNHPVPPSMWKYFGVTTTQLMDHPVLAEG